MGTKYVIVSYLKYRKIRDIPGNFQITHKFKWKKKNFLSKDICSQQHRGVPKKMARKNQALFPSSHLTITGNWSDATTPYQTKVQKGSVYKDAILKIVKKNNKGQVIPWSGYCAKNCNPCKPQTQAANHSSSNNWFWVTFETFWDGISF